MILIKQFGNHKAGEDLKANETLKKHLIAGGFVAKESTEEKPKRVKK